MITEVIDSAQVRELIGMGEHRGLGKDVKTKTCIKWLY